MHPMVYAVRMTRATKYEAFPSLRLYDRLGVPYTLFSDLWEGPLWTGHCMMLSTKDGFEDPGFFHELCHWVEASPAQRLMPDFALGKQVNARYDYTFTSSTTPHLHDVELSPAPRRTRTHNAGWGEETILLDKAARQEANACTALWFYEPIVGLTSWDNLADEINFAAYEFNSVDDVPATVNMKNMVKTIKVFNLDREKVKRYATLVRAALKKEDA